MNNSSRRKFLKSATGLVATGLVANTALGNSLNTDSSMLMNRRR